MHLTYHVLIKDTALQQLNKWQKNCQTMGLNLTLDAETLQENISSKNTCLDIIYRGKATNVMVYTSPMSDVADICDELRTHLTAEQNMAINIDFNREQEQVLGVTIAVLVLTFMLDGVLYIEGDGTFFTKEQAIEHAIQIDRND